MMSDLSNSNIHPREQPHIPPKIRSLLEAGKYRKARDEIKPLWKKEPEKYLPLLIEANAGLVQDMLGKGMVGEADQVVKYLKTIAPKDPSVRTLAHRLALASGDVSPAQSGAMEELATRRDSDSEPLTEEEKILLADQCVIAFEKQENSDLAGSACELNAVLNGLEKLCASQFAEALEVIRPIPRASPFAHWKLYIKGLVAFHQGESTKAQQLFESLPPASVVIQAAKPYRVVLDPELFHSFGGHPELLEEILSLFGESALSVPLKHAENAWKDKHYRQSYQRFRADVRDFPVVDGTLLGILSEFFFKSMAHLPPEVEEAELEWFYTLAERRKYKNRWEEIWTLQMFCRDEVGYAPSQFLENEWRRFIKLLSDAFGPNPRRDAKAIQWLAQRYKENITLPKGFIPFPMPSRSRDQDHAIRLFLEATKLAPDSLEPHLELCDLYEELKLKSERNRLLDQMTRQFPENKEVLAKAGRLCFERKAYKKGLNYLRKARELDPLDPALPNDIAYGLLRLCSEQFRTKGGGKTEALWRELEELRVENPNDLCRSSWALLVQKAVLETAFGNAQRGEFFLEQAKATQPAGIVDMYALCMASVFDLSLPGDFEQRFHSWICKEARMAIIPELVLIRRLWETYDGKERLDWTELKIALGVRKALERPYTRKEAAAALISAFNIQTNPSDLIQVVERMLEQDQNDPLFCALRLLMVQHHQKSRNVEEFRTIAEEILAEAQKRNDQDAVQLIRPAVERLPTRHVEPFDPDSDETGPWNGSDWEDEQWWDEEEDDEGEPESPIWHRILPEIERSSTREEAEGKTMFAFVMYSLMRASDNELEEIRKNPPSGFACADLDLLISVAKGTLPISMLPPELRKVVELLFASNDSGPQGNNQKGEKQVQAQKSQDLDQIEFF